MKCPYCGQDMTVGRIETDRIPVTLKWVEEGPMLLANEIKLTEYFDDAAVKAFYCETCRKFVIDQDDLRLD